MIIIFLYCQSIIDSKLTRKESYKEQRKSYRKEKKRVASELLNSLQDPAVIVLADWLKVRGTLKRYKLKKRSITNGIISIFLTLKLDEALVHS